LNFLVLKKLLTPPLSCYQLPEKLILFWNKQAGFLRLVMRP